MDAAALQIYCGDEMTATTPPARGVGWVLCWATALAMFMFAALVLTSFAYQVAAEHAVTASGDGGTARSHPAPRDERQR